MYIIKEINRRDYVDFAFLDVGQGDGSIIEIHNKNKNVTRIMIDTGRNYRTITSIEKFYSSSILKYFLNITFKNIDTLILTHNDDDHVGMRCEIINKYHVKHILISSSMSTSTLLDCDKDNIIKNKLENTITNKFTKEEKATTNNFDKEDKIILNYLYSGDEINIRDVNIKILNPPNPYVTQTSLTSKELSSMNDNNKSIVTLVSVYNKKILYTGDIDKLDELRIVNSTIVKSNFNLKNLYILKVAHHGSDGSSGDAFIKYVSPEISVISVGKNNYGHPSPRVIDLLTMASSTIRRTDKDGNITIRILAR